MTKQMKYLRISARLLPALIIGLAAVTWAPAMHAQHSSGGHGSSHAGSSHETDAGHILHDPAHGGRHGGGQGGRHGDGHGDGHGGGSGTGHADLEDKVFRWNGRGFGGGMLEDRILSGRVRPVWAAGAVPEDLELGRLNVARAPSSVRDHALAEVYASNLDKNGDGIIDADADLDAIDSPVANLGLYEQALKRGVWSVGQAALFLGRASDKTMPIGTETVEAVNLILGVPADHAGIGAFTYDRSTAYPAELLEAVFGGQAYSGTGIDAFARAADDERAVIQYLHDHTVETPSS